MKSHEYDCKTTNVSVRAAVARYVDPIGSKSYGSFTLEALTILVIAVITLARWINGAVRVAAGCSVKHVTLVWQQLRLEA